MLNPNIENKIMKLLKKNKNGMTVTQIAKRLKIHRVTASKYLWYIYGTYQNDVSLTTFGNSEVFRKVR